MKSIIPLITLLSTLGVCLAESVDVKAEELKSPDNAPNEIPKETLKEQPEADAPKDTQKVADTKSEQQQQQQPEETKGKINQNEEAPAYAYDVSFPMTDYKASTNYPWLPHNVDPANNPTPEEYKNQSIQPLGDRQAFYENYMQGCRDYWTAIHEKEALEHGGHEEPEEQACDNYERQRVDQNFYQPISMVNYTDIGYKKIKAPEHVYDLLLKFWEANKHEEKEEFWGPGNVFVNYWASDSKFVNVEDASYKGGGGDLVEELWESSVKTISEWAGQKLIPSSLYGVRVYKEGAVLSSHVDRLPLISSAIINIAQDVEEPWPLEVIGHDGVARNITMEPGEMILYESHSVVHGRPFPLKGKFYANVFIHFEPDPRNEDHRESDLPPYILEDSHIAEDFRNGVYDGEIPTEEALKLQQERLHIELKQGPSHHAAGDGDLETLIKIAKEDPEHLFLEDANGWQPIHEAARSGDLEIVEFLAAQGADVNAQTEQGHSPLQIVLDYWGQDHHLYDFLAELGAYEMGPDL